MWGSNALFQLHEGVEVPESQDEHFAGRVQFDKDVLREGRIRLHVSRLRTDDSGLYLCEVKAQTTVSSYGECRLNVTAADKPEPQKPTESPQPESPQPESPQPRESTTRESNNQESPQPGESGVQMTSFSEKTFRTHRTLPLYQTIPQRVG
ncbi:hypothetical protein L3Q82_016656 [Scortum barcoo]|uniref:Uncharacterized protein n=1 Tax=Scortum barcoo TaxID=214431 RepID=A0ACB8X7W7_9TELE|nr:hypothetical protein L3Q82_016656 [Scortum barcoo]